MCNPVTKAFKSLTLHLYFGRFDHIVVTTVMNNVANTFKIYIIQNFFISNGNPSKFVACVELLATDSQVGKLAKLTSPLQNVQVRTNMNNKNGIHNIFVNDTYGWRFLIWNYAFRYSSQ